MGHNIESDVRLKKMISELLSDIGEDWSPKSASVVIHGFPKIMREIRGLFHNYLQNPSLYEDRLSESLEYWDSDFMGYFCSAIGWVVEQHHTILAEHYVKIHDRDVFELHCFINGVLLQIDDRNEVYEEIWNDYFDIIKGFCRCASHLHMAFDIDISEWIPEYNYDIPEEDIECTKKSYKVVPKHRFFEIDDVDELYRIFIDNGVISRDVPEPDFVDAVEYCQFDMMKEGYEILRKKAFVYGITILWKSGRIKENKNEYINLFPFDKRLSPKKGTGIKNTLDTFRNSKKKESESVSYD